MKRVALAFAILLLGSIPSQEQVVTTPAIGAAVCAYNASPPALVSGQFALIQCSSSGFLLGTIQ
jgi:hypothetical protein